MNMLYWLVRRNDVLKGVRLDMEKTIPKGDKTFAEALDFELMFEMDYLNLVFKEALRF